MSGRRTQFFSERLLTDNEIESRFKEDTIIHRNKLFISDQDGRNKWCYDIILKKKKSLNVLRFVYLLGFLLFLYLIKVGYNYSTKFGVSNMTQTK
jgi:hypothetical protein